MSTEDDDRDIESKVNLKMTKSETKNCSTCTYIESRGYLLGDQWCEKIELIIYNKNETPNEKWICDCWMLAKRCGQCDKYDYKENKCNINEIPGKIADDENKTCNKFEYE